MEAVEAAAVSAHDKEVPGNDYKVRYAKQDKATPNTSLELDVLEKNPHFYDIPVNVSYSSVHVPTYVYDRGKWLFNNNTHFYVNISFEHPKTQNIAEYILY